MKMVLSRLIIYMILSSLLASCAATSEVAGPTKRFFWPPEPDEPKIEWIAAYFGDLEVQQKNFMSAIVGDDSSIQFRRPISAAGDGEGRFVVSDQELGQVFMFDTNKHTAFPIGGNSDATSFIMPSGVAVDAAGNFYIADNSSRKVFVVSGTNVIMKVMDFSEQVKSIGSLAIDRTRGILVLPDAKGGKLLLCNLTGELRSTIDGKGHFSFPNAVAVASDGSIFIADSFNATIIHFSSDGKFIKSFGKRGDTQGDLALATGIAVDGEDHVYVTDGRMHNVTVFDAEGNSLLVIGGQFSIRSGNIGRGGFLIPQGISIDKNDRIYVADSQNRRVQVFQYLNKRYLEEHPVVQLKK
jgi:DNA-binding beta-propeller fold protein YncE